MRRIGVSLAALLVSSLAQAWGPGTHTYVADELWHPKHMKANVLYGAVSPDFYLLKPGALLPGDPLFQATHYNYGAMWFAARTPAGLALAWGFTTHNEAWGADHSAHLRSFDYPAAKNGYVILKAAELQQLLIGQLNAAGMGQYIPMITPDNCHFIIEYGIDLLAKQRHPGLGDKLFGAATNRSPEMGALVARAYSNGDPATAAALRDMEATWRAFMIQYGGILKLPDTEAMPAMAEFLVNLGVKLGVLPLPSTPEEEAALTGLITLGLNDSMAVCAPDFDTEITKTIEHLRWSALGWMRPN